MIRRRKKDVGHRPEKETCNEQACQAEQDNTRNERKSFNTIEYLRKIDHIVRLLVILSGEIQKHS